MRSNYKFNVFENKNVLQNLLQYRYLRNEIVRDAQEQNTTAEQAVY